MSGQLALAMSEMVVPAAVWETLSSGAHQEIAVRLARLVVASSPRPRSRRSP
jgi:hypothetical protein